jgi:hypothetical protein
LHGFHSPLLLLSLTYYHRQSSSSAVGCPVFPNARRHHGLKTALRVRHYACSTEKVYLGWVRSFIRHCGHRHPRGLGAADVRAFLTWLAVERRVAPSTQNQALSAILVGSPLD